MNSRADGAASAGRNGVGSVKMGKYVLAWLLGVPGVVLIIVYLFMH